jgi:hypothetical protein
MARRKITKPVNGSGSLPEGFDVDDLPELTQQQQEFAAGVLSGLTATAAYMQAYNCENMAKTTIWSAACKLRGNSKVSSWINQAKLAGMSSAVVTYEGHVRELERLKTGAELSGNHGAAVQAEQLRGKASGLYMDQVHIVDPSKVAGNDPGALIESMAAVNPEYAEQLAKDMGVAWHRREDDNEEEVS